MLRRILPLAVILLFAHVAVVRAQQSPVVKADPPQTPSKPADPKETQKPDATPAPQATPKTEEPEKVTVTQVQSGARYKELLAKLKKGERDVDFTELRMSYTETEEYSPYGNDREARRAMFAALNAGKWDDALMNSATILDKNYVDINGHFGAYAASMRKGDAAKADFHKYVLKGLLDSVQAGGNGKSVEHAFVVISTDEEYALLNILGLRVTSQALMHVGDHSYDKLAVVDPETKQTYDFYFQIDIPFGWLGRSLKQ